MTEILNVSWLATGGVLRIWAFTFCLPAAIARAGGLSRLLLGGMLWLIFAGGRAPRDISPLALPFELMIGFAAALPLIVTMQVLESVSELIEHARGHNLVCAYDPLFERESNAFPLMLRSIFMVLLLTNGLMEMLIETIGRSFELCQVGTITVQQVRALALMALSTSAEALLITAWLFLPYACGLILIDIFALAINRLIPGLSLQQEIYLLRTVFVLLLLQAGMVNHCGVLSRFISSNLSSFPYPDL